MWDLRTQQARGVVGAKTVTEYQQADGDDDEFHENDLGVVVELSLRLQLLATICISCPAVGFRSSIQDHLRRVARAGCLPARNLRPGNRLIHVGSCQWIPC